MRKTRKIQGLGYFSCQTFIQSRSALFPYLEKEHIQLNFDVMFRIQDLVHKRIHQFACKFSYAGSATYF